MSVRRTHRQGIEPACGRRLRRRFGTGGGASGRPYRASGRLSERSRPRERDALARDTSRAGTPITAASIPSRFQAPADDPTPSTSSSAATAATATNSAASEPGRSALVIARNSNPTSQLGGSDGRREQAAIGADVDEPDEPPPKRDRGNRSEAKPHAQRVRDPLPAQRSAKTAHSGFGNIDLRAFTISTISSCPPKITPARSGIRRVPRTFFCRRPSRPTWPSSCESWAWRANGALTAGRISPPRTAVSTVLPGASRPAGGEERAPDSCVHLFLDLRTPPAKCSRRAARRAGARAKQRVR